VLLTLLALAAPLPALALNSDGTEPVAATPAPAALEVSTALDSCGIVDTQVVCKLSVTFGEVPGATNYTATVTRADGSVVDYGSVGAGGASLWVPYVGAGNYSVRVSAYGAPPEATEGDGDDKGDKDKRGNLITSDASEAEPVEDDEAGNENADERDHPGARFGPNQGANASVTNDAGADPNAAPEATVEQCEPAGQTATEPIPEPPPLPEPPPDDLDPNNPDEDADGILDEQEKRKYDAAVAEQAEAQALAEEAQSPEQVTCPAR
jgi:hypothetical protein